jgi:hypothetical protein
VVQFVSGCVECIGQRKGNTFGNQQGNLYTSYVQIMIRRLVIFRAGEQEEKTSLSVRRRDSRDASEAFRFSYLVIFTILGIRRIPTV